MNRKEFEKYLENINFIITKKLEIELNVENINQESLHIIDEISTFIIKNNEYFNISSFLNLSDNLVEFIESYNEGIVNSCNIKNYFLSLKNALRQFEDELKQQYEINIYFYGDDEYGIINNNLAKMPIKKIVSKKHLENIAVKNGKKSKNKTYNILFLTKNISFKNSFFNEVLDYNKIASSIKSACKILYKANYDFRYMKCALNKAMDNNLIENIVVGNSYPLVGIDKELFLQNSVNLSMSSQDLYYSFELAKKAILSNKNISKCILGISYYLLRHDLSMGESEYSKSMVKKLYYPLLKDYHNYNDMDFKEIESLNDFKVDILIKTIFNLEKIEEYFMSKLYDKNASYYNDEINPRNNTINWSLLDGEQKEIVGINRANQHNKLFKYENTKNEYFLILDDFIRFTQNNNIEFICVVFPTTKYYNKNIKKDFKKEFEEILLKLKNNNIKVIDLRLEENNFDDIDYADSDHLNSVGATKATNYIIKELLHK